MVKACKGRPHPPTYLYITNMTGKAMKLRGYLGELDAMRLRNEQIWERFRQDCHGSTR